MQFEDIKALIQEKFPEAIQGEKLDASPHAITISSDSIHAVCEVLHSHEAVYFDSLSSLTGIDNGVEQNTMEVIYHLYSIPHDLHLALRVELDRLNPNVDSVSSVWRAANWHERETYDLLGIHFNNHSDLRRILLPDDWVGYPLRKDYVEQEMYHDVVVKWEKPVNQTS